jgi:hypothetical protein
LASLLNVWSCVSSLGLRARGGRAVLQKGESKDKPPTTLVMHVCPSHSRFQPISADIERSRKLSKEARFRALKAVARVRIPSGLPGGVASQWLFRVASQFDHRTVVHSGHTPESAEALAESMASATTSSRSPKRWPYRSGVMARSCGRASAERPSHPRRTRWSSSRPCGAVSAGESRESSTLRLFVSERRGGKSRYSLPHASASS